MEDSAYRPVSPTDEQPQQSSPSINQLTRGFICLDKKPTKGFICLKKKPTRGFICLGPKNSKKSIETLLI